MPTKSTPIMIQIDDIERPATPEEIAQIEAVRSGDTPLGE